MSAPPPPRQQSCFELWGGCLDSRAIAPEVGLYQHQIDALNRIREFWNEGGRGTIPVNDQTPPCVISLPTGSGKSVIAALIPFTLRAKRVLVICPDKENTTQLAKGLSDDAPLDDKVLLKRGLVTLDELRRGDGPLPRTIHGSTIKRRTFNEDLSIGGMVITNAQKFSSKEKDGEQLPWKRLGNDFFDVVIVDEAHHFPATFWSQAITHFYMSKVIFLTATPFRTDGRMVLEGGRPALHLSRADAVQRGIIRDVESCCIGEQKQTEEKARKETLEEVKRKLEEQDISHPFSDKDGNPQHHVAMACTSSTTEAKKIVAMANDIGLTAHAYNGGVKNKDKRAVMARFKSGRIKLLVICNMLLEGFDHPPVSVVAIMNRVTSSVRFSQFVGRAVRVLRHPDGTPVGANAICIHHKFYKQSNMFDGYINDRVIQEEVDRAETNYASFFEDAEEEEEEEEEDDEGSEGEDMDLC